MDTALSHLASFALGLTLGIPLDARAGLAETEAGSIEGSLSSVARTNTSGTPAVSNESKGYSYSTELLEKPRSCRCDTGNQVLYQDRAKRVVHPRFPAYDMAWQEACLRAVRALLREWDQRFGQPPGGVRIREVNWWQVATDEDSLPDFQPLQNGEALRFHDWVIHQFQLPGTLEAFIKDRKRELKELPAIHELKARRAEAMNRSADVLRLLVEKIVI